jgi:hypothetical protein
MFGRSGYLRRTRERQRETGNCNSHRHAYSRLHDQGFFA